MIANVVLAIMLIGAACALIAAQFNLRRSRKLRYEAELLRRDAQALNRGLYLECESYRRAAAELERQVEHYREANRAIDERGRPRL